VRNILAADMKTYIPEMWRGLESLSCSLNTVVHFASRERKTGELFYLTTLSDYEWLDSKMNDELWNRKNLEGSGCSLIRRSTGNWPEWAQETTRSLNQNSSFPGQHSTRDPLEYKIKVQVQSTRVQDPRYQTARWITKRKMQRVRNIPSSTHYSM
jgi:hypothetical protein